MNFIFIGNAQTEDRIQELTDRSKFTRILTSKRLFIIVTSAYDRVKSTKIVMLGNAKYLNVIVDENEVNDLKQQITQMDQQCAEIESVLEIESRKVAHLKEVHQQKRGELSTFQNKKRAIELLNCKIKEKERQINEAKDSLSSIDRLKEKVSAELATLHDEQMHILEELSNIIKICVEHTNSEALSSSKLRFVKNMHELCK